MPSPTQAFHPSAHSISGPAAHSSGIALHFLLFSLLISPLLMLTSCAMTGGGKKIDEGPAHIFYPPPPGDPKIQFLATYSADVDVVPERGGFAEFIRGPLQGTEIRKPYGVAVYDGAIFVCDIRAGLVQILDIKNRAYRRLGDQPDGRLMQPVAIAIDEDGTRYVADFEHAKVVIYDSSNRFIGSLDVPEDPTGELAKWAPSDVAIGGGKIYVTDIDNGRIVVFSKDSGEVIRTIGRKGSEEGELFMPTALTLDSDGNIYVGDTGNFRVLKFNKRGKFKQQFGSLGKRHGEFVRPKGVAVDRDGRLYVVDASFENVQVFNSEGQLLLFFGGPGSRTDALNLPAQVAIDYDNVDVFADLVAPGYEIEYLILVTSQFGNSKVNVYGLLKESSPGD